VCKSRWPGRKLWLTGGAEFKSRAQRLALDLGLEVDFAPEPDDTVKGPRMRMKPTP
jgi:hypothetical protein